jgi:hypothetical protein
MMQEQAPQNNPLVFCFDRMSNPGVLGYPNLAPLGVAPDDFDYTWPRTVPCRLFVYFKRHNISVTQCLVSEAPVGSWYPVALAWFDFDCDYFSLIPKETLSCIRDRDLKILFYYHEGDNPAHIKQRLDFLCDKHQLPESCYFFISANSSADRLVQFSYFPDHEFFFHYVNRRQSVPIIEPGNRKFQFTALNRSHKWWRASVMSDLQRTGLLDLSLWSYNTDIDINDMEIDNPLEIDSLPGWRDSVYEFVKNGPYICDSADSDSHNDHRSVNLDLYTRSYFHLVLETHFDADGSGGAFITEKTYKCFKFGQPFVMIGPAGTLAILRKHGYRLFDGIIDNDYDTISNNTQRWIAVKNTIKQIQSRDMHELFKKCLPDITHNQRHFVSGNSNIIQVLINKLAANSHAV